MNQTESKKPTFGISLLIVAFLFIALVVQVAVYGSPDIHLTLVFASAAAAIALMLTGTKWKAIEEGILHGCGIATIPMLILMFIGMLIPAWIAAGTIPTLIYVGLKIISPTFFLLTAALVCSMASIATGSSYTTGATFGVAFMGISLGLGIPAPLTAGAVISGAIIGDKLSPLSDSTNLAAGVCEANLFDHIKSMFYTTIPAFIISIALYTVIGFRYSADNIDTATVDLILDGLTANFNMSPLYMFISLLPMIAVVFMAVKKINALAAMVIAAIFGMLLAMLFQGRGLYEMMGYMNYGFSIDTGIFEVNKLLNRGGIQAMMWTVSLGYLGLSYGGILEKTGVLDTLLNKMIGITNTPGKLIITHVFSAIAVNMLSASQYVAIMIPGRMFLPAYKKLGIKTSVASRTCEDAATVTSPLVPWGLCGVYFSGVLGVATLDYLPYTFLALFVPVIAIIYAATGRFIFMEDAGKVQEDDI
ncbi:MAG: Na+/H+ antiporter NhaC [Bacillota bacterium]|nr:Na+/H+ antiporter NhaC [Bacillota bacterium]NLV70763.1 Na+/H+ antiporter NhaC [Clostridiales bacterium]